MRLLTCPVFRREDMVYCLWNIFRLLATLLEVLQERGKEQYTILWRSLRVMKSIAVRITGSSSVAATAGLLSTCHARSRFDSHALVQSRRNWQQGRTAAVVSLRVYIAER